MTLEPDFRFLEVAYPYVARRLLTDEDPALRARLIAVRPPPPPGSILSILSTPIPVYIYVKLTDYTHAIIRWCTTCANEWSVH